MYCVVTPGVQVTDVPVAWSSPVVGCHTTFVAIVAAERIRDSPAHTSTSAPRSIEVLSRGCKSMESEEKHSPLREVSLIIAGVVPRTTRQTVAKRSMTPAPDHS